MMLDADTCYRALAARDPRFDGRFFVAVTTTGIYCRPVCRARTPGRERCRFYRSAAEAERAGFRACFRCRPESAPGQAPLDALPRLVARGVHRIDEGFLNDHSVEDLAAALGVTGRHLRRAFESVMGVTPIELAQSRRLALAKHLLHDTDLAVADVAFASGFRSLRRFNASFQARFRCAPSRLRGPGATRDAGRDSEARAGDGPAPALRLRLEYRQPFAWPALLAFLRARAIPGVEHVTGDAYQRTVSVAGQGSAPGVVADVVSDVITGVVTVRADAARPALVAEVSPMLAGALMSIATRLRRLFDLDADPLAIAATLGRDPALAPRVAALPGLRVPGAFDAFELIVRAVLGQQVSVRAATTLAGRLVERFGTALGDPAALPLTHVFPRPEVLAGARVHDVAAIGMPEARAAALVAVATACATGGVTIEPGAAGDDALRDLESLPGIGPWTAQYIAMRALHWPDAFPASDLGIRKALGGMTARQASARAEAWRPWRAYAVMHLWHSLTQGTES